MSRLSDRPFLSRIGIRLTFSFVWLLFHTVRRCSFARASQWGGRVGSFVGPKLKSLNRRARQNLNQAFPEKSDNEIEVIIEGMWRNFGRSIFEFMVMDRFDIFADEGPVTVYGREHLDAVKKAGGLLFSGHIANWEVMPKTFFEAGLNPVFVYRAANNPLVNDLIQRHRARYMGSNMVPKGPEGARGILKALKSNQVIAMLVDQKMNNGISVPLFGRDAMTAPALAQLALKSGKPVVGVQVRRLGDDSRFEVHCEPPFTWPSTGDSEADVLAAMIRVNAKLEEWISQNPEQWFWMHNRWPVK